MGEDTEADEIDRLQAELDSLDAGAADAWRRKSLEDRLTTLRSKRTRRVTSETWDTLESLYGYKLRR